MHFSYPENILPIKVISALELRERNIVEQETLHACKMVSNLVQWDIQHGNVSSSDVKEAYEVTF